MTTRFEDPCWEDIVTDDIRGIYKFYHRPRHVGERPGLLAIDLYNLAYDGGPRPVVEVIKEYPSSCGENAWNAIEPTKRLLAAARAAEIPIIYSTDDARKEAVPGLVTATKRQVDRRNAGSYDIRSDFQPLPGDLVIYKKRASAFFGTPLIAHLVQIGVRSLIVCGESTSGCVRATAVDAYSYGFDTTLVEECCFDRNMLSHKVSLFDLHHKYASVMKAAEVIGHLERLAGGKAAA